MDTAKELGEVDLFRGLSGDDLAAFAGIASEATFGPEDVVYESGSAGDSLYVIIEGNFAVRVLDEHDDEVDTLGEFGPRHSRAPRRLRSFRTEQHPDVAVEQPFLEFLHPRPEVGLIGLEADADRADVHSLTP